jgi:phosphate/sulfate permease
VVPGWLTDTNEAARHPYRAASFAGVVAAICWGLLAYFVLGPHSVSGAALFAVLIGAACALGTTRGLRAYAADPSRSARRGRVRRSALRLAVMWGLLLVVVLLALLFHS